MTPDTWRRSILANDTTAAFRFRQIRSGEDWIDLEDLERYPKEFAVVIDSHP
ncbi:hypothetical protein AB0B39_12260 [Micromonospora sp. NPDC049114]|uniref:hypothetical protein n=1 Tax=unclassified Micromonospora TaxID=2617518 RepID=UPI0033CEC696